MASSTDALAPWAAPAPGPRFDLTPPQGGYVWWYLDAISADGREALTAILFVGSVFSPYYAWSKQRDPNEHCAVNIALYGARTRGWAMTERTAEAVSRDARQFVCGPSRAVWREDGLDLSVDEPRTPPFGRIAGRIRVRWTQSFDTVHDLDGRGRHFWRPIAPLAEVEVALDRPAWRWSGHGYVDSNTGAEPLHAGFRYWTWSRARLPDGAARIYYDADRRESGATQLALKLTPDGRITSIDAPPFTALPRGFWGVARQTRSDGPARVMRACEDAPFYTRSLVETHEGEAPLLSMHESLCLDRFANPLIQAMLPVRMPRVSGRQR